MALPASYFGTDGDGYGGLVRQLPTQQTARCDSGTVIGPVVWSVCRPFRSLAGRARGRGADWMARRTGFDGQEAASSIEQPRVLAEQP